MHKFFIIFSLIIMIFIAKFYFFKPLNSEKNKKEYHHLEQPIKRYYSNEMRYHFNINGISAQIPYATNMDISKDHKKVTKLILSIHSSSYNPDIYLDNSLALFKKNRTLNQKILIISPAFFRKDKTKLLNIVKWSVSPFWGSSRGIFKSKKIELSSYEVLDDILTHIITSKNFPNLSSIVILGHSAGGQLVNRYASCNTIEDNIALEHEISMKYLVMAPSSYVYFDGRRAKNDNNLAFYFPFGVNKKYNFWGYGVEHLYSYHKRHNITADDIRFQYKYRKVLYLVGENDTTDRALDKSRSAMFEGKNRKERLQIYYNYLQAYYGKEITDYQTMSIIPNVGHWGKALMLSDEGKRFILSDIE